MNAGLGIGLDWGAGAAAVVAGLFVGSEGAFGDFLGRAAGGAVDENGCEHEGLRFDSERRALVPGRIGNILVAIAVTGSSVSVDRRSERVSSDWDCESKPQATTNCTLVAWPGGGFAERDRKIHEIHCYCSTDVALGTSSESEACVLEREDGLDLSRSLDQLPKDPCGVRTDPR